MGRGANKLPLNDGEKMLQRALLLPYRRQRPLRGEPGLVSCCLLLTSSFAAPAPHGVSSSPPVVRALH